MNILKAILIDDEIHAIENLQYYLQRHCPEVEVVEVFSDPKEALLKIPSLHFDVIFLDIEMPWLNGFELLSKLEKINFEVIFVTAYDQYAINAFRYSAIDYLLKPIRSADLMEAVAKLFNKQNNFDKEHLNFLLQKLNSKETEEKIALPTSTGLEFIKIKNIVRCESDGNYSKIFLQNKEQLFLAKTLKYLESLLHLHGFIRIHQSHLISEAMVRKYINTDNTVIMEDGSSIPVARSKKPEFLARFKN